LFDFIGDARYDGVVFRAATPGSCANGMLPGTADATQLGGFCTDPGCFNEADQPMLKIPRLRNLNSWRDRLVARPPGREAAPA
jgi:hypothetical protein